MNFAVFVTGHMISAIPALWFVGWMLKQWRRVPDELIPFILTVVGVVAGLALDGLSANSAVQGLLAAAAAVLGHQTVKQGSRIVAGSAQDDGRPA